MIYMNMDNPSSDPLFRNEETEGLIKGEFGGWRSSGGTNGQLRLELWQDNPIRDCEGTVYARFIKNMNTDPGAYLSQVYRGGGTHSSSLDGQEGAAYKVRIRADRSVVITKEVRHPDYASNVGGIKKLEKDPTEIYLGIKLVAYNMPLDPQTNRTPVKIEAWCDEYGMSPSGQFNPQNQKWQKYAEYIDKGGWKAGSGNVAIPGVELGNNGNRKADEILNTGKGAVRNKGNLFAYRTDNRQTEIKYMSFRKIKNPVGAA